MISALPKWKVELHVHLDAAVRPETIWELSKKKGLPLPGDGSLEALKDELKIKEPTTLCDFLDKLKWVAPCFRGDPDALERITYEFCQDKANEGVIYVEMRCAPHLLTGLEGQLPVNDVVASILRGMHRGEQQFQITARLILCCFRPMPEISMEVLELCDKFRNDGVVAIDVAGDEAADVDTHGQEHFNENIVAAFQEAKRRGIHRTAHAGEAGPANGVQLAMDTLFAERIGHGYHILGDPIIYEQALQQKMHFETCPYSSILTGSVKKDCPKHPIVKFAEDGALFSIGTDDPSVIQTVLADEYQLLYKWGLTEAQVIRANLNALRASFLPEEEKQRLIKQQENAIGIAASTFQNN